MQHAVVWVGALAFTVGCTQADPIDTSDTAQEEPVIPWRGDKRVSGQVYFFEMQTFTSFDWMRDVDGAVIYILEAPSLRMTLDPDDDHRFEFKHVPEGADVTLAVEHPDYFPHLTATWTVGSEGLHGLTFQSVSHRIAGGAAGLLDFDVEDTSKCQMATTVTAPDPKNVWAVGEPGATVSIDPPVDPELGPYYFSTLVLPDVTRTDTSEDGGVVVVGAEPGEYVWSGHKDGVTFTPLRMKCLGGWLTNASPPWGMNASLD